MLSQPANPEPEDSLTLNRPEKKGFFRSWFISGPKLLLEGKLDRRTAIFMAVAVLPAIAVTLFMTLPGILFPTPQHNQFFHFAKMIHEDAATLIPVTIGVISTLFCLRLPLGP